MMTKPLHKIIEEELQDKIESGFYQENDLIPKEMDLAEHFKVSRPTVRQAIQSLVDKGLLEKRKRRGTIVKKTKIPQEFTHVIESYNIEMNKKGLKPKTKVINLKKEEADEEVSHNLGIDLNEPVYKLVRLRYGDDVPLVFVTTYVPAKFVPGFLEIDFTTNPLYEVLENNQRGIERIQRKLEVAKADETISDLLDIEVAEPIFYFHSIGFDRSNQPIEYSISKYRGDLNYFMFEINN